MSDKPKRVLIHGSERKPLPGAHAVGPILKDERFEVTLLLRPRASLNGLLASSATRDQLPKNRRYMSREEYDAAHGADPQDVAKVEAWARENHLIVIETSTARRSVVLSGTAEAFSAAFETTLQQFEHPDGTYRGRVGGLTVPEELTEIIQGVFGLDDRPQAHTHFQKHRPSGANQLLSQDASFTPVQLAKLYDFPAGVDGAGECIAIIELGGGFRPADLDTYFTRLGLPVPSVKAVQVDGGKNHPTSPDGPDGEVMLDIEVAAAVAPKAQIVVYFAPNTDQGFLDAINSAIHDTLNKPSVVSISWGGPESSWTQQSMQQFDQAFQAAAALGVTVCCAAGDNGSGDGVGDGQAHVDFPASSPFALGCGGTRLVASGNAISSEVVWNESPNSATGGGISSFFPAPDYQGNTNSSSSKKSRKNPRTGRPGCSRGRRPRDRLPGARRRAGFRHRGHQRSSAFVGRPGRALQPEARPAGGLPQPADLRIPGGQESVQRHHLRRQRRFLRRRRLGRLHGLGLARGTKLLDALGG